MSCCSSYSTSLELLLLELLDELWLELLEELWLELLDEMPDELLPPPKRPPLPLPPHPARIGAMATAEMPPESARRKDLRLIFFSELSSMGLAIIVNVSYYWILGTLSVTLKRDNAPRIIELDCGVELSNYSTGLVYCIKSPVICFIFLANNCRRKQSYCFNTASRRYILYQRCAQKRNDNYRNSRSSKIVIKNRHKYR